MDLDAKVHMDGSAIVIRPGDTLDHPKETGQPEPSSTPLADDTSGSVGPTNSMPVKCDNSTPLT